jgi:SAM-dependent MidA family methyltransferase
MRDAQASSRISAAFDPEEEIPRGGYLTIAHALAAEARAARGQGLTGQRDSGPIPFDRFMHWALYHPSEGYYAGCGAGAAGPFGPEGDFITASGLGPWFAGALAQAFVEIATQAEDPGTLVIRELGAGDAHLAADLLLALEARHCLPARYEILEPSPAMQQMQRARIAALPHHLKGLLVWLNRLDDTTPPMKGLILANEVADALPVKLFEWSDSDTGVWEWGLRLASELAETRAVHPSPVSPMLDWVRWPAPRALREVVLRRAAAQESLGLGWASGHRGEWSPWLQGWAKALGQSLAYGELLVVDYGYEQYELDHPDRAGGTLAAHRRHRRLDDWSDIIAMPGQQDITAHVNFTELAEALRGEGLDLALQTQAAWLLDHGVLAQAEARLFGREGARGQAPTDLGALRSLAGLQTLLSDAAMGQSFLVLSARKGIT